MRRLRENIILSLVCFIGALWTGAAQAVVIKDLYEALVPVESQSMEERKAALSTGLVDVITRASGQELVLSENQEDPIVIAVQNPTRFTTQYRYRQIKNSPKLELWIKFDEKAVNNLLQNNNIPVWGHTRPQTLVWLVVTENGQRRLLGSSDQHTVKNLMTDNANKRGLPLSFPVMDLTDRGAISISDVWGNLGERIRNASERYKAEAIIVGRLYKTTAEGWSARWSIYLRGERQDVDVDKQELIVNTVTPVLAQTARSLAREFAMVKTEQSGESVVVQVKGVSSLKQFNYVIKYLKSLTAVSEASPVEVSNESATFKLNTHGGRLGIAQAIKLGHVLSEQPQVASGGAQVVTGGPDLVYLLAQ